mmetsp:Transcript_66721/g.168344  ORF Transcript_66721/g.168344 Transcript_66721/m.168344 type:complete len:200 (-) Transcript_66721:1554-2153(-)
MKTRPCIRRWRVGATMAIMKRRRPSRNQQLRSRNWVLQSRASQQAPLSCPPTLRSLRPMLPLISQHWPRRLRSVRSSLRSSMAWRSTASRLWRTSRLHLVCWPSTMMRHQRAPWRVAQSSRASRTLGPSWRLAPRTSLGLKHTRVPQTRGHLPISCGGMVSMMTMGAPLRNRLPRTSFCSRRIATPVVPQLGRMRIRWW